MPNMTDADKNLMTETARMSEAAIQAKERAYCKFKANAWYLF